ncbi:MAG: c(7)-type cytochrome triheme domain-containing protein [Nitrospinota bacterium]
MRIRDYRAIRFLIILFLLLSTGSCSFSSLKERQERETEVLSAIEGFGEVPFNVGGRLAFLGSEARKNMDGRNLSKEESLKRRNIEFEAAAKLKFKNNTSNIYWVGPDEYKNLYAALTEFPKDGYGYPEWVKAAKTGYILPLSSLYGEEGLEDGAFNLDIVFPINDKMMANVLFPHNVHNYWLSCQNCHPAIFVPKKRANKFGMTDVWGGKFCGKCHGRVSFQPKGFLNCIRCHSVKRDQIF